ncbi:MAG: hypothetical protein ACUVUG_06370, partial [Candidatus Aminicenantia bacterium]
YDMGELERRFLRYRMFLQSIKLISNKEDKPFIKFIQNILHHLAANIVDIGFKRRDNLYMRKYFLALFISMFSIACNQSNLPLPEDSTVEIIAYPNIIPLYNGVSTITVIGYEKNGRPLRDGVIVNFKTDLGIIEPITAETKNGKAISYLKSNGTPGNATVTAWFIGATSLSVVVKIQNHNPVKSLLLVASSNEIGAEGGLITLSGYAFDDNNAPVPGAPLIFGSTRGSLSSNGDPVITDSNGKATVTLSIPPNDTGSPLQINLTLYHGTLSTYIEITQVS